jgi:cholesterol oxidase
MRQLRSCMIGCGRNAKNKLTVNDLSLAETRGAVIHELQEVHVIRPLPDGGFAVEARHPGWLQRAAHLDRHTYTAEQVIVSAHAYGSAKLLHRLKHTGVLAGLSDQLGQRARTNSGNLSRSLAPTATGSATPTRCPSRPAPCPSPPAYGPTPSRALNPCTPASAAT